MGFFDQTRYIRTVLLILPMGLIFLGLGVKNTITQTSGVDGFIKTEGAISDLYLDNIKEETCNCYQETAFLKIEGQKEYFFTRLPESIEVLKGQTKQGDVVSVWTSEARYIKQVAINENIIIAYNPSYVFSYLFLILGVGVTGVAVYYLFKHPEDLKG